MEVRYIVDQAASQPGKAASFCRRLSGLFSRRNVLRLDELPEYLRKDIGLAGPLD